MTAKVALKHGSSKQGKTVLACIGSKNVESICDPWTSVACKPTPDLSMKPEKVWWTNNREPGGRACSRIIEKVCSVETPPASETSMGSPWLS